MKINDTVIRKCLGRYDPPALAIVVMALGFCLARPCFAAARPVNVLMIVVDDMNDWVGCLGGHPDARTPNIDRLAGRGMLFTNAHCAAPVCNPSRVATMTGRRPSTTGIYSNRVLWHKALEGVVSIPRHFRQAGYYVAGGGKIYHHMPGFNRRSDWHEYFDQVFDGHYQNRLARGLDVSRFSWPDGFPLNRIQQVQALSKPPQNPREFDWGALSKADSETGDGVMVTWAEKFLADLPKQPFFLATGIYRPHLPFYAPAAYFEMFAQETLTLPEIKSDDCEDLPAAGKAMAASRREDLELVRRLGKYRELVQAYLASIAFADALIGRLLDAVDAGGLTENTIIVLWSDHGWHLGEKQHLHKFTLWERSTRVPFIIAAPGTTFANGRCSRPVALMDLFPTLIELCQLPSVDGLDGQSLLPLLQDPKKTWDQPAVTTHGRGNHAVRSEHWRYIRYADGGEELYDHRSDPHEWTNLAAGPETSEIRKSLEGWLPGTSAEPRSNRGHESRAHR